MNVRALYRPVDNGVVLTHLLESGGVLKSFFQNDGTATLAERPTPFSAPPSAPITNTTDEDATPRGVAPRSPWVARLAVYEAPAAAPHTEDVTSADTREFIEVLSARVHAVSRESGGSIPYTVIREVVENFIHADFTEPVISILEGGATIRFADQGPGLPDKEKAQLPGFTTATAAMKSVIRGVGSGLPIVREFLAHSGGSLVIEDNLREGTVVTVSYDSAIRPSAEKPDAALGTSLPHAFDAPPLTTRQKRVLSLVLELGEAGPTIVSKELSVALSTAYRDLAFLESSGLIQADETGKRVLTDAGAHFLDDLFGR